jgi:anti-sigma factor RsiW
MMNRNDMLRLNAFIDGELGLDEQLQLEARLREDAALRVQVERMRALRAAVRDVGDYHSAQADLRRRVDALTATPAPASPPRIRWPAWKPWATAFATIAAAAVVINAALLAPREDERIRQDVVASHVRATLGERLVDVASSDHHTVKPWLSSKLDFSPPVNELTGPGSALLGGRVDYVNGHPVAVLAYRHAGHRVDDFIWPAEGADRPVAMSASRGFNVAHWTRSGMTHWLISDLNPAELAQLAHDLSSRA